MVRYLHLAMSMTERAKKFLTWAAASGLTWFDVVEYAERLDISVSENDYLTVCAEWDAAAEEWEETSGL